MPAWLAACCCRSCGCRVVVPRPAAHRLGGGLACRGRFPVACGGPATDRGNRRVSASRPPDAGFPRRGGRPRGEKASCRFRSSRRPSCPGAVELSLSRVASAGRSPSPLTTSYQFRCHFSGKPVTGMTGTDTKPKKVAGTDTKPEGWQELTGREGGPAVMPGHPRHTSRKRCKPVTASVPGAGPQCAQRSAITGSPAGHPSASAPVAPRFLVRGAPKANRVCKHRSARTVTNNTR